MTDQENTTQSFFVSGVCCATEEAVVRKHVDALVGGNGYTFNPVTCELRLRDATKSQAVVERLKEAGFPARSKYQFKEQGSFWQRHQDAVYTVAAVLSGGCGMLAEHVGANVIVIHGLLLGAILLGGWKIFVKAWKSARTLSFDMNLLMSIAVIGALLIDKWSEGAAVIILFAISLMLESYSNVRTRRAIQSLMSLSPQQACVIRGGQENVISAEEIVPGQTLVIRPGERVPIDGVVEEGRSFVDQSIITGESNPVSKSPGDHVYAGSINTRGSLHVNATSKHEDTALARIVHLVEEAQLKRAPVQTFVERFARIYTPTILAFAVVVAILPPLVLDASFGTWFYRALVLLVIACPCALVISTPVTIVSALTKGARLGILIKGGRQIETLSKIRAMAFDKTGTLTLGQPRVTDIVPLNSLPRERLLQIIAALEHRSEHPLASAVLTQAVHDAVEYDQLQVESFEALPGLGVRATIDGEEYFLGNHQLCEDRGFCSPEVERILQALESDGKTVIVLGRERQALCIVAVRDMARIQSKSAINRLRGLGVHRVTLLSGDHETSARQLAEEVGIPEYQAGLLPQRKIEVVQEMKMQHGVVAMVGDGINDAPALAAASVGIAMGVNGSDAALETADVVLMGDDLSKLPTLIGLSRKAMSIVKQNIVIALSLKLLFLILSIGGVASLWMAVLADDGAALVVILNGLRVLSLKEDV